MLDIWMDSAIRRRTSGASFPSALIIQASSPRRAVQSDDRRVRPNGIGLDKSKAGRLRQADTEPGIVIPISRDQIRFGGGRHRTGLSACLVLQNLDSDLAEDLLRRAERDFTNACCQGRGSQ